MKFILLLFFLPFPIFTFSQQKADSIDVSSLREERVIKEDTFIFIEDFFPSYPGGFDAMQKFLIENLRYPNIEACVEGRVILRFVVKKDGAIENIEVLKSLHPDFDKEALRVVRLMPKWNPAINDKGDTIDYQLILPIKFKQ